MITRQLIKSDVPSNYYLAEVTLIDPLILTPTSVQTPNPDVLKNLLQELLTLTSLKKWEYPAQFIELELDRDSLNADFNFESIIELARIYGTVTITDIIFMMYRSLKIFAEEENGELRIASIDSIIEILRKEDMLKLNKKLDADVHTKYLADLAQFIISWKGVSINADEF